MPCTECQNRQRGLPKANKQTEFTTESIKDQRKAHSSDMIQPFRNGELSKEYVEQYGTKSIKVSDEEVRGARKVWTDDQYYKN